MGGDTGGEYYSSHFDVFGKTDSGRKGVRHHAPAILLFFLSLTVTWQAGEGLYPLSELSTRM